MLIGSRQTLSTFNRSPSITIEGGSINQVASTRSLGVYIDENLPWSLHIHKIHPVCLGQHSLHKLPVFSWQLPQTVPVMTSCSRYVAITSWKVNKTKACHITLTTLQLICQRSILIWDRQNRCYKVVVHVFLHITHAQVSSTERYLIHSTDEDRLVTLWPEE